MNTPHLSTLRLPGRRSRHSSWLAPVLALLTTSLITGELDAKIWIVAPTGGDFTAIQPALNAAQPGDTILVRDRTGGYLEKIQFPRSGSATAGPVRHAFSKSYL